MNSSGNGGGQTRLQELLGAVPIVTLSITVLCLALQIWSWIDAKVTSSMTICVLPVVYWNQWWRVITAAYFHGGLLHIVMNMMSFYYLGVSLENRFGSIPFFGK
jgi:membrane associated rhomboid family serine protease